MDKSNSVFYSKWPKRNRVSILEGKSERDLYYRLCQQYSGKMIAPQVSFSALIPRGRMHQILREVLQTRSPAKLKKVSEYLAKSRVDFVIYDYNGYIDAVVECNGWTHGDNIRRKKDLLKAKVLQAIGIPLIVFGLCGHLEHAFKS